MLTTAQQTVANTVLDEESGRRQHVVVALSGAHAYGFPSPDSDLDLKAIHVGDTRALLGLDAPSPSADRLETIDGVEIDYTSNELGPAMAGILAGNGNYIERVLGALIMRTSSVHDGLRQICQRALCRQVHRHYFGFAQNQYRAVLASETPPAKRVLYVLRTALTGIHLLRSGELVVDVTKLLDDYGYGPARALIEVKKSGELHPLDPAAKAHWLAVLERVIVQLEAARDESCLPEMAPNQKEARAWLVDTRVAQL